jgi:hypothetical protein
MGISPHQVGDNRHPLPIHTSHPGDDTQHNGRQRFLSGRIVVLGPTAFQRRAPVGGKINRLGIIPVILMGLPLLLFQDVVFPSREQLCNLPGPEMKSGPSATYRRW